ncbi:MAG TPA: CBS domain-containing protein [Nitrososphaera sp.]|nr:CBS domain-containing protein [Nitrososphaera sp.]
MRTAAEVEKVINQTILSALIKRVGDIAEPDFVSLPHDTLVGIAVKTMRNRDVSSILVSKDGEVVGILTERDFLYRVMAENRGPYKVTIGQVMTSPLVTIEESASVRDAIALMQSRQIRRLPVVKPDGSVMGLITLKTVIGNMPSHNIDLAEVEYSRGEAEREAVCPYCRSVIGRQDSMAVHMEGSHMQGKS